MKCLAKVSFHLYALMFLLMLKKPTQVYIYLCMCVCRDVYMYGWMSMVSQNQLECNYVFRVKTEKQTHLHRTIYLDYRLSRVACLTDQ